MTSAHRRRSRGGKGGGDRPPLRILVRAKVSFRLPRISEKFSAVAILREFETQNQICLRIGRD